MTYYYLYRLYDESGLLLYVGSTANFFARMGDHEREQVWWNRVAEITVVQCSTVGYVKALEELTIVEEKPKYNVRISRWSPSLLKAKVERRRAGEKVLPDWKLPRRWQVRASAPGRD